MRESLPDPTAEGARLSPHDLPRVVIVGAGQTGRELAGQLAGERRVVVLDTDPAETEASPRGRSRPLGGDPAPRRHERAGAPRRGR